MMKDFGALPSMLRSWKVLAGIAVLLAASAVLYVSTRGEEPENAAVETSAADTLALNIICTPTLDCLPFYHALESGVCDSLGLDLVIRTEVSQFDIDSIMRRTRLYDGAVLDDARLAHYRSVEGKARDGGQQGKTAKTAKKGQNGKGKTSAKSAGDKAEKASAEKRFYPMPALTEAVRLENTWRLVTSGTLRIREVAKMKKRTVALARFSAEEQCLEQALAKGGLREPDVYKAQINDVALRRMMLDENQVDAALLPEPYATMAVVLHGHRLIWSADTTSRAALYLRTDVLKKPRKQQQMTLLQKAYRRAAADLNRRGAHAADSALIKRYNLPEELIDTLRLPKYN